MMERGDDWKGKVDALDTASLSPLLRATLISSLEYAVFVERAFRSFSRRP